MPDGTRVATTANTRMLARMLSSRGTRNLLVTLDTPFRLPDWAASKKSQGPSVRRRCSLRPGVGLVRDQPRGEAVGGLEPVERVACAGDDVLQALEAMLDVGQHWAPLLFAAAIPAEEPGAVEDGAGEGERAADDDERDELAEVEVVH